MHGPAIGAHASVRAVAIGKRRATYEDVCKVPDTMVAEIIDGELVVTPRPVLPNVAAFDLAPDWVCEVVSPSTGAIDRSRKMRIYARERVGHLWIVDPILRTLEVYRLEDAPWAVASTHGGTDAVRAEPFDAGAGRPARWSLPP